MNTQLVLGIAGLLLGALGLNAVVILRFTWKQGQWNGRVTALLEEHQRDLVQHDKRINQAETDIAHLKGALGA